MATLTRQTKEETTTKTQKKATTTPTRAVAAQGIHADSDTQNPNPISNASQS